MKKVAIIGGNISGLTTIFSLQDELEPSEVVLIEKNHYDLKTAPLYGVTLASIFEKILNHFDISFTTEPLIYDLTQIHDSDGKIVMEFQTPISIVDLPLFQLKFSKSIGQEYVLDRTKAMKFQSLHGKNILRISTTGRRSGIIEATTTIDSSGFDWFLARESMEREEYNFFRHNYFTFYQVVLETTRTSIEREALHIIFNEYAVPGGFAVLFSPTSDKTWILGFYNAFLTHRTPLDSINTVKNSLGIIGRITHIFSREIFLGRPLLTISPFSSVFLFGASNLGVYPTLFSGIVYNITATQKLAGFLLRLLDSYMSPEEISLRINNYYAKMLFPISEIFDAIRILLLSIRSNILEDLITWNLELLKMIFFGQSSNIGDRLLQILIRFLSSPQISKKAMIILRSIHELLEVFKDMPSDSMSSWIEFAQSFSREYSKRVTQLVPKNLAESIAKK